MKLLERYPSLWLSFGENFVNSDQIVPVECTPYVDQIAERIVREGEREPVDYKGRLVDPALTYRCCSPWDYAWLEWSERYGIRARLGVMARQVQFGGRPDEEKWSYVNAILDDEQMRLGFNELAKQQPMGGKDANWLLALTVYISISRSFPRPLGRSMIVLDDQGGNLGSVHAVDKSWKHSDPEGASRGMNITAARVMECFAFLNCRNVSVRDEPRPPGPVRKKRRKNGKQEIVYKQLVVDGKPVGLSEPSENPDEEAETRFHLCRGHFADHRAKGLFGDPERRDVYWVPQHTRGRRQHGEVIKDYSIEP